MIQERGILKGMNGPTTTLSILVISAFVLSGIFFTEQLGDVFNAASGWILTNLKWYYIGSVAFFLFFCFWLIFSRYGHIKLGQDDDKPEFGYLTWFSMLFSAGMGIGLIFWSIAEPIYHFQSNPFITEGLTAEAAQVAMRLTIFHWGLHPWAIYVVVGLVLSYFSYRKGLPLTIRSCLYPIIGDKMYGPAGHAVDVLAVFGTIFGVATSLGLGVTQMNTGLNTMFGLEVSVTNQIILIAIISVLATISVATGVNRGIKILSQANMWLTLGMLVFLLVWGPTRFLLHALLQNTGDYLANVLQLSMWTNAIEDTQWQSWWTAFYWAWWIAWAPFVGMFIARISKGRTIREFVIGVLLVPTLMGIIWLTAFGGTALYTEMAHQAVNEAGEMVAAVGQAGIVDAVKADVSQALYVTLDKLDAGFIGTIAAFVATLLIATYFITSSDSGTLVVTTILSMGNQHPPTSQRVFWGLTEGLVAAVLLLAGGLKALQTASIVAALPFSMVMLIMVYGLVKALREEDLDYQFTQKGVPEKPAP
jgi:choline/glycine/proline betaine transport protein